MAAVKNRSFATGALALAGLAAAGIALLGNKPESPSSADIPPQAIVSETAAPNALPSFDTQSVETQPVEAQSVAPTDDPSNGKAIEDQRYDRRRLAMSGSAEEIEAARNSERVGSFRTIMRPERSGGGLPGTKLSPKLDLDSRARADLRRDLAPAGGINVAAPGPIEFIVKLKDPRLTKDLQREFSQSPGAASRHLKKAMGGGGIVQRAKLQGFTLGGEAILKFDGPRKMDDFAKAHDEIQRALSAAPGVSYAEQNYTADINSAQ